MSHIVCSHEGNAWGSAPSSNNKQYELKYNTKSGQNSVDSWTFPHDVTSDCDTMFINVLLVFPPHVEPGIQTPGTGKRKSSHLRSWNCEMFCLIYYRNDQSVIKIVSNSVSVDQLTDWWFQFQFIPKVLDGVEVKFFTKLGDPFLHWTL